MTTREQVIQAVQDLPESELAPVAEFISSRRANGAVEESAKTDDKRQALFDRLAARFMDPDNAGIDWDMARDGKLRAWPLP